MDCSGDALMIRSLIVTWTPRPGEPHPCAICSDSGLSFLELLSSVSPLLEGDGIPVTLVENLLFPGSPTEEGGFLLNGRPLEELLRESDRAQFLCHSSRCQPYTSGVDITRDEHGIRCIRAPEILFRKAILRSLEEA